MGKKKAQAPEWKLEAFSWLKVEDWTPDRLLTQHTVDNKRYCKVCDQWVEVKDEKAHCTAHRQQRREMVKRQKVAALAKAREERARKKAMKEAGES